MVAFLRTSQGIYCMGCERCRMYKKNHDFLNYFVSHITECIMACWPKTPSRSVQNDVGVWKSRMISFDMIAYSTQAVPSRAACHPTRESIITGTFLKDH